MSSSDSSVSRRTAGLLFADVRGYSSLTEPQLRRFFSIVLPKVGQTLSESSPFYVNTWGDAVVAAFDDCRSAAMCALALRDLFSGFDWSGAELPALTLRCALHAGPLYLGDDPVTGGPGIVGTQVVLAARVEPVIIPGHVWATDTFVALLSDHQSPELSYDSLGERALAKEWGAKTLYRVRRSTESADLPSLTEGDSALSRSTGALGLCLKMIELGTDEQRIAALDMLEDFDEPEALKALVASVKNKRYSQDARRMALLSLAKLKNPVVLPDLLDLLRDPETPSDLLLKVVTLLGKLEDIRALDPLREIAGAESHTASTEVVEAALVALAQVKDSRALDAIIDALTSDRAYLQKAAMSAVGISWARGTRASRDPTNALIDIATRTTNGEEVRSTALEAINIIGPGPELSEALANLAKDESEPQDVRFRAMISLGLLGSHAAKDVLERIAENLSDPLAGQALLVMVKAKEMNESAKKSLLR